MRPTAEQIERLAFLAEEAAEVMQACMKIIRHGWVGIDTNVTPNRTYLNAKALERELGDLAAAVNLCIRGGEVSHAEIEILTEAKLAKLHLYLHHPTRGDLAMSEPYSGPVGKEIVAAALEGSIAKWRAIVAGEKENDGSDDCPLCQLFNPFQINVQRRRAGKPRVLIEDGCVGCPVQLKTGKNYCNGSPFEEYEDRFLQLDDDGDIFEPTESEELLEIAAKELAFLESLKVDTEEKVSDGT